MQRRIFGDDGDDFVGTGSGDLGILQGGIMIAYADRLTGRELHDAALRAQACACPFWSTTVVRPISTCSAFARMIRHG